MTSYLGAVAAMADVGCVSDLGVDLGSRTFHGGGPGTLSPARVRVVGAPARMWRLGTTGHIGSDAALASLARRQSRAGGAFRFVPCDAVEHNIFTPAATEDLSAWTGLAQVAPAPVAGVYRMDAWPAVLGRVVAGSVATTPRVPVVRDGTIYLGVHTTGLPELRVITRDAAGAQVAATTAQMVRTIDLDTVITTSTVIIDGVGEVAAGDVLFRSALVGVPVDRMTEATVELQVRPDAGGGDVWVAWPSVSYASTPYTAGRAAEQVYIEAGGRTPRWAWGDGFEDAAYTVTEVGV